MRGQAGISLIFLLIAVVLYVGLHPVLDALIVSILPSADDLTAAVLRLFLPIAAVGILFSFLRSVVPTNQGY